MCFLSYAETTFKRQRQAGRYKHTENERRRGAGDCLEGTARGLETFSYREIRMLERRLTEGRTEVGWHGVVAGEQMRTKYNDPYVTKCHNETHSSK